ncbi:MAG TPA: TonB-dependent receptor [Thermoanaerobaculia bacterium]|nr:TonB-dependent receptor [Thermoanaerobaculia bacterium]
MRAPVVAAALLFALWVSGEEKPRPLSELDIEEMMNITVTSAARKEQRVADSAVAIYVITRDEIERSGATTLPEVLRLAPGLDVARIDGSKWAISARGFNGRFANKLLVMIDGRSVYTPLYSGVHWDVQDTLLQDIDRIEVIRGPGAALWGANAVNGVINIITRPASETSGTIAIAGGGNEELVGGGRHGFAVGEDAFVRVYAKYFDQEGFRESSGRDGLDNWRTRRGGFRFDGQQPSSRSHLTIQGDIYSGDFGGRIALPSVEPPYALPVNEDSSYSGGNLIARISRSSNGRDSSLQLYYDRTNRDDAVHREARDTFDIDMQSRRTLGRHDIIVGGGFRQSRSRLDGTFSVDLRHDDRVDDLFSAFLQDEILVRPDVRLTLGTKVEHNEYTGFELQPNVRLLWRQSAKLSSWAAVSRAVRTPAEYEVDGTLNTLVYPPGVFGPLATNIRVVGNEDYQSNSLIAYELGQRLDLGVLTVDAAAFIHRYDALRTLERSAPAIETGPSGPYAVIVLTPDNKAHGSAWGSELVATFKASHRWKLSGSWTWYELKLKSDSTTTDPYAELEEGDSPRHQLQLRSYLDLTDRLKFDTAIYYVDDVPDQAVRSYARIDARLAWMVRAGLALTLTGTNLQDNRHPEFGGSFLVFPKEIERSFLFRLEYAR